MQVLRFERLNIIGILPDWYGGVQAAFPTTAIPTPTIPTATVPTPAVPTKLESTAGRVELGWVGS